MVFLMQAGFALVETGLTRAKNAGNIVMKNMADMIAGAIFYWAFGAAIAYGAGTFIGTEGFFDPVSVLGNGTQFVFQMVFAATAATIVSGAVAERMKFSGYVIISIVITGFIYPTVTHWHWPLTEGAGAWLAEMGYHDFAGSSLVHMTGGVAALVGAAMLGPRLGKYGKDGKPRAIPGHNMPFAIFGVFVLWFGWFGFNGGSTLAATGLADDIGIILLSTNVAAGAGGLVAVIVTWIKDGKPDVAMTGNGVLAGLVAITAGTNFATGPEAAIIGGLAGAIVVGSVMLFDRIRIDDPVGAISVHGVVGAFGTLAVGVIAAGESNGVGEATISLGTQAIGVAAIAAFVGATSLILFYVVKVTVGIRVSERDELDGLDVAEHGIPGYAPDVLSGAAGPGKNFGFASTGVVAPAAQPVKE
jgi:ammonium transporter, Amt family